METVAMQIHNTQTENVTTVAAHGDILRKSCKIS